MKRKEQVLSVIKAHEKQFLAMGIIRLGIFGSYTRGEQVEGSDIDILIEFAPQHERFDNLMSACDLLERLFIDQKIDVVTKNGLSPHIGKQILKEVEYA